jgi:protein TonB
MYPGESLASAWNAAVAERQLRLLVKAVSASLVLHALLLYALPILRDAVRAPIPPLTARLAKPAPPEPPRAEPPAQRPVAPSPAPAAKPAPQRPAPAIVPVAPILSVEPARQSAEPAFTVPPAPPAPAAMATAQQVPVARAEPAPGPAASGPDAGSIARFRLELIEIAKRYKRYPRIARDNNWEGRVNLRVAFGESGAITSQSVTKSSGRAVLDDEAKAMFRSAQPHVAIPPSLRGKAFVLEFEVEFVMREDGS